MGEFYSLCDHFSERSKKFSKMTISDEQVVEETLRMANISHFLFRLVTKDIEYKGTNYPGLADRKS